MNAPEKLAGNLLLTFPHKKVCPKNRLFKQNGIKSTTKQTNDDKPNFPYEKAIFETTHSNQTSSENCLCCDKKIFLFYLDSLPSSLNCILRMDGWWRGDDFVLNPIFMIFSRVCYFLLTK